MYVVTRSWTGVVLRKVDVYLGGDPLAVVVEISDASFDPIRQPPRVVHDLLKRQVLRLLLDFVCEYRLKIVSAVSC